MCQVAILMDVLFAILAPTTGLKLFIGSRFPKNVPFPRRFIGPVLRRQSDAETEHSKETFSPVTSRLLSPRAEPRKAKKGHAAPLLGSLWSSRSRDLGTAGWQLSRQKICPNIGLKIWLVMEKAILQKKECFNMLSNVKCYFKVDLKKNILLNDCYMFLIW